MEERTMLFSKTMVQRYLMEGFKKKQIAKMARIEFYWDSEKGILVTWNEKEEE